MIAYKNRELDLSKRVDVYRCLNRKGYVYSIKQSSKVIGHSSNLVLKDVTLKVNHSGKKRAIETGVRNVHAMINGYLTDKVDGVLYGELNYYPFCDDNFMCNGSEIINCNFISINESILKVYGKG